MAALWGVNFLAIHASLEQFPPFLLVAMRWAAIAIPTMLLVPRPRVPLRYLLGYGLGFGVLQFTFLYWAMASGMPTGMASLVLQCSAPFTVLLGAVLTREHLTPARAVGTTIAVVGLAVVGSTRSSSHTWWPFVLTVLGGLGWALGNLALRQAHAPKPLHLTLWMSVVPPIPMLALSLAFEGPTRIWHAFATSGHAWDAWAGLVYTVLLATVAGSGLWAWLMSRHPAGVVAPYSMLVPVVGLTTAWVVLGEMPLPLELLGSAMVVLGVLLTSARFATLNRAASGSGRRSPGRPSRATGPTGTPDTPPAASVPRGAARPAAAPAGGPRSAG